MEVLGRPLAWLGVPLLENDQVFGLLSIGRNVERPFNSDERETALAFAQRITELLRRKDQGDAHLNELPRSFAVGEAMPGKLYGETLSFPADLVFAHRLAE